MTAAANKKRSRITTTKTPRAKAAAFFVATPALSPAALVRKFYPADTALGRLYRAHARKVAAKALEIARGCGKKADLKFIRQAALLHDIGIFKTRAPKIGCRGRADYICHGVLGGAILRKHGLTRHARVCERHVGVGISARDIRENKLPLPLRDMVPESLEEIIVCVADKFYSKSAGPVQKEHTMKEIRRSLEKFGADKVRRFDRWIRMLGLKKA